MTAIGSHTDVPAPLAGAHPKPKSSMHAQNHDPRCTAPEPDALIVLLDRMAAAHNGPAAGRW
jgi:hypothetical protein